MLLPAMENAPLPYMPKADPLPPPPPPPPGLAPPGLGMSGGGGGGGGGGGSGSAFGMYGNGAFSMAGNNMRAPPVGASGNAYSGVDGAFGNGYMMR